MGHTRSCRRFPQTNANVGIDRTDPTNPNVLSTVASVCPENGFIVAIANGGLQAEFLPGALGFPPPGVSISLSRNSLMFDANHELAIRPLEPFTPPTLGLAQPVSIQRADRCQMGRSITYRFLATKTGADVSASMKQPSLIIMFFRDPF
jgi:hypothetical protein